MPLKGLKGGSGVKPLGYGLGAAEEATDPNFNQTVLLLHADGSEGAGDTPNLGDPNYKAFRDNSASPLAITVNGNAYGNDFSPYYYADGYWSEFYNTASDSAGNCNHKILPASFLNDLTTGNKSSSTKTIEAWVYPTSIRTNANQYYAMAWFCKGNVYFNCGLSSASDTTTGKFVAYHFDGSQRALASSSDFTMNQWYHVAVVIASETIKLYVDGVLEASGTWYGIGSTGIGEVSVIGGTASNNDWNGYISNLRISSTARYTSAFTPSTSPFTSDSDTLLLTNQSNRFIDNSSSANAFTFQNNPQISTNTPFTQSKTANVGSGFFDGTDDYLNATLSSAIGTGDMTVEFWYYPTVFTNYLAPFAVNASGSRGEGFNVGSDENGKLKFVDTDGTNYESGNNQLQLHSWNHIAIVRDGSTVRIFHNGTQIGTVSNSENWTGTIIAVGARADDFSEEITGYIADCNLVVGTAKYDASGYTVPTSTTSADANTKFLTCQYSGAVRNVGFVDDSKYNHRITRNGDVSLGTFSPFSLEDGYWSVYFDGSDDELNLTNTATIGTGNFTMEMWVFPHNRSNSCLIDSRSANGATDGIIFKLNSNKFQISGIDGTTDIPLNEWTHLAVVREGTGANQTKMYINGALEKTITFALDLTSTFFGVGVFNDGGNSGDYKGYISNLRVVNDTVYTDAFTVSSEPLTAISNTDVLICQSNKFIDNSTNGFAISLPQGTAKVTPFSPFAATRSYSKDVVGGSVYCDAAADYLSIEQTTEEDFKLDGDTDWCVEFWLYMINPSANYARVMQLDANSWAIRFDTTTSKIGMGESDAGATEDIEDPTALPANQWTHFAFTHKNSDSTLRLFRNGALVTSTTSWSPSWTHSTNPLLISRYKSGSANFFGNLYLGSFRIVKADYIYDSAFTPPTAPFTANANTVLLMNSTNAGIIDHTMRNNLETEGNTRISTIQKKFGTGSIYFDGTNDSLKLPNNPNLIMSTGNWTIEFFMYYDQSSFSGYRTIIDQRNSSYSETSIVIYFDGGNSLDFYTAGAMRADIDISSLSVRTWHHVALVKNGSTTKFYLDGTATGTSDTSDTRDYVAVGDTHIGERYNTSQHFLGYLDDFRITKGVARYTSNFTAPTKAFANK